MKVLIFALRNLLLILWPLCAMAAQRSEEIALPAVENVQQQLISAAKAGDANRIRPLLAQGALLVEKDSSGHTPFNWAAIYGHVTCLQIFLDELENNTPLDRRDEYYEALKDIKMHNLDLGIFQRNPQSAEIRDLAPFLLRMYDRLVSWGHGIPGCQHLLTEIYNRIRDQLSLNIVLNCFSSGDNVLQQALLAAGAHRETANLDHLFNPLQGPRSILRLAQLCREEELDPNPETATLSEEKIRERHLIKLRHFAIREDHENLLRSLMNIRIGKTLLSNQGPFDLDIPPLHCAAMYGKARMAKLLLEAGVIDRTHGYNAFCWACQYKSFDVGQLLFESGATIEGSSARRLGIMHLGKSSYLKMLLQGSKVRYAPTYNDAKLAMQNVASLIYILGITCNLPAYIVYEILLFATGEQKDEQGKVIAPEWTRSLKKSLAVLYLYKCNGNKLFPLWKQTIRCLEKDPQKRPLLISKLENFIRPFLGNDVIRLACMHFMQKIADDAGPEQQSVYENDFFGQEFELYYEHLKGSGYLAINGADAP